MRLYFPPDRTGRQTGQVRTMTAHDYIQWLKREADVIRILPINRSPNPKWSCTDSRPDDPDRFFPLIETFRGGTKTGFHGISATTTEREKIGSWLPKARKDGYINIGKAEVPRGGKRPRRRC